MISVNMRVTWVMFLFQEKTCQPLFYSVQLLNSMGIVSWRYTIKSKNVKSLRGNCQLQQENQFNFMEDNAIPLKRRRKQRQQINGYI